MNKKINIGVTGTGSLIGQAIIKSIKRSDLNDTINFIGLDYFKNTVGSFWCDTNYLLPDILKPEISEDQWLTFLIDKIIEHKIKLLFVGVDFELPFFSKNKQFIENQTGSIVLVSSEEVIAIADDKYLTYEFLKKNNLSYPESWLPVDGFDYSKLIYPLIVKPRKGARSVGVSKVNNKAQLMMAINSVKDPIIQQFAGADETEFTCGVIFLANQLKKSITLNRTLKEGNTYISHYRKDYPANIKQYINEVATILKPFGASNFQLRIDKMGIPKIFEINARHSGTTYIRSLFGYKEVEYIINSLLFNSIPIPLRSRNKFGVIKVLYICLRESELNFSLTIIILLINQRRKLLRPYAVQVL